VALESLGQGMEEISALPSCVCDPQVCRSIRPSTPAHHPRYPDTSLSALAICKHALALPDMAPGDGFPSSGPDPPATARGESKRLALGVSVT
jgi:hypothetical protein